MKPLYIKMGVILVVLSGFAGALIGLAIYFHDEPASNDDKPNKADNLKQPKAPPPQAAETIFKCKDWVEVTKKFKKKPSSYFFIGNQTRQLPWKGTRTFEVGKKCQITKIENKKVWIRADLVEDRKSVKEIKWYQFTVDELKWYFKTTTPPADHVPPDKKVKKSSP